MAKDIETPMLDTMTQALPNRWFHRKYLSTGGRIVAYYTLVHNLYNLLAGGFEIALILRLTGSFERIVVFNLLFYILLYSAFVVGTLMIRSGKASRGFRLDLLAQGLGCLYVMVNFADLGNPVVLAGFFLFKGISEGLFWSTRHSALIHCISDEHRDHWSLVLQTLTIVMGVVLPVLSGFAISYLVLPVPGAPGTNPLPAGYFPVYALTGVLATGALALSPPLVIPPQTFRWSKVASLRKAPGNGVWVGYNFGAAFTALAISIAVGILNFYVLKTEFNMGVFAALVALASAVFFVGIRWLTKRFPLTRVRMVLVGSSGELVSRLVYYWFPTVPGLVGKSLLDSFIIPLRGLFGDNILRRRVEIITSSRGLSVAEGILFQESTIFLSRVLGCLVLILVLNIGNFEPVTVARTVLLGFLGYSLVDFLLVRAIDRGNRRLTDPRN